MSLTLTAEPAVIDGARSYAEHSGMTRGAFFADDCFHVSLPDVGIMPEITP